jgi:hypothetical protein
MCFHRILSPVRGCYTAAIGTEASVSCALKYTRSPRKNAPRTRSTADAVVDRSEVASKYGPWMLESPKQDVPLARSHRFLQWPLIDDVHGCTTTTDATIMTSVCDSERSQEQNASTHSRSPGSTSNGIVTSREYTPAYTDTYTAR